MPFEFPVPTPNGNLIVSVEPGSSALFVGANGGGKTRLAVQIETTFGLKAHRLSAHRALKLNPGVAKISERDALRGLRYGNADERAELGWRQSHRWQTNAAVSLLNDFDFLVQALFADQANRSLVTHTRNRAGDTTRADPTKLEQLVEIWDRLLPHRRLHISGDDIRVSVPGEVAQYNASDMSDGERAIFYLIGQTMEVDANALLIVDEPELHVHRSIMSKLWDELEAARQDCAFVFITHDLEFAASRVAQKFIIKAYDPAPRWTIEPVPADTGFSEEITTLILGSRRPILFVEGDGNSLDFSIYRGSYPGWTVIPRGSCEEVIHSVVTMRRNRELTRVTCSGIVDADDHEAEDIAHLADLGIAVLPVSEIESVILLPSVSRAIAECEGYEGADVEARLNQLKQAIFDSLNRPGAIDAVVAQYCRRRIDRILKKIDLSAASTTLDISTEFHRRTAALNIEEIARTATTRIQEAVRDGELTSLLAYYDNKGLMALAATILKGSKLATFESWLTRVLRNGTAPALVRAITDCLPQISAE